ncbi:MAG: hypothetical protein ED556_12050 [Winogradskyella sp.]|uniref:hypothetical protein n=1 Tax=Winogradskyella sp. TaxID=1883156 RepID=UPI000F3E9551|nr:hypothetical protein [Winogradskyella sp.]RNC84182.1 MAG: hypothetical protein ED556_12050 [Winogradskyella sp.]
MKKIFLLGTMLLLFCSSFAQTNLYENPEFDEIAKNHKSIAIIKFKTQVKLRPKQMKDMTPEKLEKLEQAESEGLQAGMYSWFLKRKKRGKMTSIEVQDPKRTNALLAKQGITYENLQDQLPEDLAKILGVDAIINGDYETNKPMSEGASVALGLVLGFWGSTNSATINMSVYNGADAVLLWNYNKKVRGSFGSTPEDLVNVLMRKASRRLAYTKKK